MIAEPFLGYVDIQENINIPFSLIANIMEKLVLIS